MNKAPNTRRSWLTLGYHIGTLLLIACPTAIAAAAGIHDRNAWLDAMGTANLDSLSKLFGDAQRSGYPSVANEIARFMLFDRSKLPENVRETASLPEFRAEALSYAANAFANKIVLGSEVGMRKEAKLIADQHPNLAPRMIISIASFHNNDDLKYLLRFAESSDPNRFRPGILALRRLCTKESQQVLERLSEAKDEASLKRREFIQETRDLSALCVSR